MDNLPRAWRAVERLDESQSSRAITLRDQESRSGSSSSKTKTSTAQTPPTSAGQAQHNDDIEIEMDNLASSGSNIAHPGTSVAPRDVHPGNPNQMPDVVPLEPSRSHPQNRMSYRVSRIEDLLISKYNMLRDA